jgi:hypothetical protein
MSDDAYVPETDSDTAVAAFLIDSIVIEYVCVVRSWMVGRKETKLLAN